MCLGMTLEERCKLREKKAVRNNLRLQKVRVHLRKEHLLQNELVLLPQKARVNLRKEDSQRVLKTGPLLVILTKKEIFGTKMEIFMIPIFMNSEKSVI